MKVALSSFTRETESFRYNFWQNVRTSVLRARRRVRVVPRKLDDGDYDKTEGGGDLGIPVVGFVSRREQSTGRGARLERFFSPRIDPGAHLPFPAALHYTIRASGATENPRSPCKGLERGTARVSRHLALLAR